VCKLKCEPGVTKCDTGQPGACAAGTVTGCDQAGNPTGCKPDNISVEVCDGKDNDCDGQIDETLGIDPTCHNAHPSLCQDNFLSDGEYKCVNGALECDTSGHFCGTGGTGGSTCGGYTVDNKFCGVCEATPCICPSPPCQPSELMLCVPNDICKGTPGNEVCVGDSSCSTTAPPTCWHPAQIGACCGLSNCTP